MAAPARTTKTTSCVAAAGAQSRPSTSPGAPIVSTRVMNDFARNDRLYDGLCDACFEQAREVPVAASGSPNTPSLNSIDSVRSAHQGEAMSEEAALRVVGSLLCGIVFVSLARRPPAIGRHVVLAGGFRSQHALCRLECSCLVL